MNRSLLRLCLWAASAAVAGGRPLSWLFNSKQSEFAATCRRLEREAQEFESGERVLLEQLRQMRVTTGNLRAELRESVKKSDEAVANATAYVAQLEAEVAALKDKLAAAEARVRELEGGNDATAAAAEAAAARAAAGEAEAAKLKAALAKANGELKALKHAAQGDALNARKPTTAKAASQKQPSKAQVPPPQAARYP